VRIAALASGTGTILEALIAAELPLALVVVDRPCRAEDVARAANIELAPIYRTEFDASFDREAYTARVTEVLASSDIDLVAMAGFGTVLAGSLLEAFPDRVLNTHPALLPAFKGWHAVRDALAAGVKVTGWTVHLATAEVDEGRILAQEAVVVIDDDDEQSLHERIKDVERRRYPEVVAEYAAEVGARRETATTSGVSVGHHEKGVG
jgi:phosphoribosylglycinamide formyltransferase 1